MELSWGTDTHTVPPISLISHKASTSQLAINSGKKTCGIINLFLRHSLLADSLLHCPPGCSTLLYYLNSTCLSASLFHYGEKNPIGYFKYWESVSNHMGTPLPWHGTSWMYLWDSFHSTSSFSYLSICFNSLSMHTTTPSAPASSPPPHSWTPSSAIIKTYVKSCYTRSSVCQMGVHLQCMSSFH